MLKRNYMNSKKLPTLGYVGVAAIVTMILLAMGPMSNAITQAQATPTDNTLTSDEVNTKANIEAMIQSILASVAAVPTVSDNADLRFSEVGFVEPNGGQAILIVECMPDENPTGTFELYAHDIESLYTFPAGMGGQNVALFSLVQNNGEERQAVAIGTYCIDEDNGGSGPAASKVVVRNGDDVTNTIKNIVKFSNVVNNIVTVISNQTTNTTNTNTTNTNTTNTNTTNTNNTVVIPPPVDNGTDTEGNTTDTENTTDTTTTPPPVTNDTTTITEPRTEDPTDNTTDATTDEDTTATVTAITPEELQTEGTPETPTAPVTEEEEEDTTDEDTTTTTTTEPVGGEEESNEESTSNEENTPTTTEEESSSASESTSTSEEDNNEESESD